METGEDDNQMTDARDRRRRWKKWLTIAAAGVVMWMVLNTQMDVNPPLEKFAGPTVTIEQAVAYMENGKLEKALPHFITRTNAGDPEAAFIIGNYYNYGHPPFHVDYCSAFDFYYKAAKMGHPEAQLQIARMMDLGYGGYLDKVASYFWGNTAKNNGNADAAKFLDREIFLPDRLKAQVASASATWTVADMWLEPAYRIPVVPGLWRIASWFTPVRICRNPTLWEYITGGY